MEFTSVEWIALIVIIVSAIKMFVLLVKPVAWMNFARSLYAKPGIAKVVGLILAGIVFYYLYYVSGITIIQILAVTAFVALMLMIGLADEADELVKKYQSVIKKGNLWKRFWFYTLLWIILLAWGIKELFF
ncbi:MAG: hypothetical protein ABIA78_00660 [archaeon]